ncbi:MAG: hypothetical protein E7Z88_07275 [Cyanobacteria bacterium SIG27]|nr:hypothetical protein [Cyanobacteria bacterium SIG27]
MVKKSGAFSLAEAMISMLIIAMVGIAALPVLTKSKPPIESVSLRGQYGCWYEPDPSSGKYILKEWYFDERTPRTPDPIDVVGEQERGCILKLDQRPANFYILASGAGSSTVPAQVSAVWTPALSNELAIVVGQRGINVDVPGVSQSVNTTVSTGGMYDVTSDDTDEKVFVAGGSAEANAAGPREDSIDYRIISNGLNDFGGVIPENAITCKLVSEATGEATSCEVLDVISHGYNAAGIFYDQSYKVRINGCETYDESGNPDDGNLLTFFDINFSGLKETTSFSNVPLELIQKISNANSFGYSGFIRCGKNDTVGGKNVKFGLEFANSSYLAQERLLNFEKNTLADWSTSEKSKMSKMIEMISIRRQSELTERILKQNPGGIGKNGAVIILW